LTGAERGRTCRPDSAAKQKFAEVCGDASAMFAALRQIKNSPIYGENKVSKFATNAKFGCESST
jgi:hypothetical protein